MALAVLGPAALGYERYAITGDSMSGSYDRGSMVFAERVPIGELRVGDVITYEPPPGTNVEGIVTHRIIAIRDRGEGRTLRTKGDANGAPDPWRFTLAGPDQARAAFSVPHLGYVLAALSLRWVRMLAIGVPALLVAVALSIRLIREVRGEVRLEGGADARIGPEAR